MHWAYPDSRELVLQMPVGHANTMCIFCHALGACFEWVVGTKSTGQDAQSVLEHAQVRCGDSGIGVLSDGGVTVGQVEGQDGFANGQCLGVAKGAACDADERIQWAGEVMLVSPAPGPEKRQAGLFWQSVPGHDVVPAGPTEEAFIWQPVWQWPRARRLERQLDA